VQKREMPKFSQDKVNDFKHVIYNLLVDGYNSGNPKNCIVFPIDQESGGKVRDGFQFNEKLDTEKRIPELYGYHMRGSRLEDENQMSPFIQDLYKSYLRSALELLGKYFQKVDKYCFLYEDNLPLFVPGGTLSDAESRIKKMKSKSRKSYKVEDFEVVKKPPKAAPRKLNFFKNLQKPSEL